MRMRGEFICLVSVCLFALASCQQRVKLYCDEDTPCQSAERPFCDVEGDYPASEGVGNTCIPDPSAGADAGGGDGSTGDGADAGIAPAVVGVSPGDGALGVLADAEIVIEFSKPMDSSTVEAAYESEDLPAEAVSFFWNGAGNVLTIVPDEPLTYAQGDTTVVARSYSFSVAATATDEAGNELEAPLDVTFSTARRIVASLLADGSKSGTVALDGSVTSQNLVPGYGNEGEPPQYQPIRAAVTFDLSALPEGVLSWNSATFSATQGVVIGTGGNPYVVLGDVQIHDASFSALGSSAIEPPGSNLGVFSGDIQTETKSAEVSGAFSEELSVQKAQFLLKFQNDDPGGEDRYSASFSFESAQLDIDLLAE